MKPILLIVTILVFLYSQVLSSKTTAYDDDFSASVEEVLQSLSMEIQSIQKEYALQWMILNHEMDHTNKKLKNIAGVEQQIALILQKMKLQDEIEFLRRNEESDVSKIRYIKGLQIIKILYEKTLALDHHFSSAATFKEINSIANPNNYKEFSDAKELIQSKKDKKIGFDLTTVLGNNIYASVAHSLISLFTNSNTPKEEKEKNLTDVECILDFTLSMHNDLNIIYFETVFLQKSNENIMEELHQLFTDYTKPIDYDKSLIECRTSDDWGAVREKLNRYIKELDATLNDTGSMRAAQLMQINLEFPIDRLLQFITLYNAFINQGTKFYEKFGIMLNSYENRQQCASKIPIAYAHLQESISVAIEKFNTAYKPIEINGSKMKEILYGINEYE